MRVLTYSTTITLTQHTYMLGSGTAGAFLFLPTPPHLWHRARNSGLAPSILASRLQFWPRAFNSGLAPSIVASCPVCLPSFRKRIPHVDDHPPAKAHKNLDFVLETPENEGPEGQKSTKMEFLCSGGGGLAPGREEIGIGKHNRRDAYRKRGLPANHRARFKNISS